MTALVCMTYIGQSQDQVYLKNGEFYQGQIIAIGNEVVLIKSTDRIFSVDRIDVNYVFRNGEQRRFSPTLRTTSSPSISSYSREEDEDEGAWFNPLDRKLVFELGFGIHVFSPFAVKFSFTNWYNINERWSTGLGFNFDFFRYGMTRWTLHAKRFGRSWNNSKAYTTAAFGVSSWQSDFQTDAWGGPTAEISNVVQGNVGAGIWSDTGLGLVFTIEMGVSALGFSTEETIIDPWLGNRTQTTQQFIIGPYLHTGMVF